MSTYRDEIFVNIREHLLHVAHGDHEQAISRNQHPVERACPPQAKFVGQFVAIHPPDEGFHEFPRCIKRVVIVQTQQNVSRQDLAGLRGLQFGNKNGLHPGARLFSVLKRLRGCPEVVTNQSPESDVIGNLLVSEPDALPRQTQVDDNGGEGADGGDAVEVVRRHAKPLHVPVVGSPLRQLGDVLPDSGMKKSDSYRGRVAIAARFDRIQ